MKEKAKTEAEAHWEYTKGMLEAHGVSQHLLDATAYTYHAAFEHGWKHAVEELEKNNTAREAYANVAASPQATGESCTSCTHLTAPDDTCEIYGRHFDCYGCTWYMSSAIPKPSFTLGNMIAEVLAELDRATEKYPQWPTDPLHALAVLGEEYGELNKGMLQLCYEPHKTNKAEVRAEAVQTAAMAIRLLMSLDRYEYGQGTQHSQQEAPHAG